MTEINPHVVKGIKISPPYYSEEVSLKSLEDYQDCVKGWIEAVTLRIIPDQSRPNHHVYATMYVNEQYLLGQFNPGTDYNMLATIVAGRAGRPDLVQQGILGPCVVVGPVDREGYDQDIPDEFAALIAHFAVDLKENFPQFIRADYETEEE